MDKGGRGCYHCPRDGGMQVARTKGGRRGGDEAEGDSRCIFINTAKMICLGTDGNVCNKENQDSKVFALKNYKNETMSGARLRRGTNRNQVFDFRTE